MPAKRKHRQWRNRKPQPKPKQSGSWSALKGIRAAEIEQRNAANLQWFRNTLGPQAGIGEAGESENRQTG